MSPVAPKFDGHANAAITRHMNTLERCYRARRNDELKSEVWAAVNRWLAGDESLENPSSVLAICAEVIRRVTGNRPKGAAIDAAVAAALGQVGEVVREGQEEQALTMAGFWLGGTRNGAHLIAVDDGCAKRYLDFLVPIVTLLGGEVGVVLATTSQEARRAAYEAMLTIASYVELASDYLRDNMCDYSSELVHMNTKAAIVGDADRILAKLAMSTVFIAAPRTEPFVVTDECIRTADLLQRDRDYQVVKDAIFFSPPAIQVIKRSANWERMASVSGVAYALEVERSLLEREGLVPAGDQRKVAEISVQGFARLYGHLGGLSRRGAGQGAVLADLYGLREATGRSSVRLTPWTRQVEQGPNRVYLASERILDEQQSIAYAFRAGIRDAIVGDSEAAEVVHEVIRTAGQRNDVRGALARLLMTDVDYIRVPADDAGVRVAGGIEEILASRGPLGTWELVRQIQLAFFDLNWRAHLARMRFLRRNTGSLYGSSPDVYGVFVEDAAVLFSAFWENMYQGIFDHLSS